MKYNVTEVEFDFDDDYAEESKLTFDEEIEIRDLALGVWVLTMKTILLKKSLPLVGGALKTLIMRYNSNDTYRF